MQFSFLSLTVSPVNCFQVYPKRTQIRYPMAPCSGDSCSNFHLMLTFLVADYELHLISCQMHSKYRVVNISSHSSFKSKSFFYSVPIVDFKKVIGYSLYQQYICTCRTSGSLDAYCLFVKLVVDSFCCSHLEFGLHPKRSILQWTVFQVPSIKIWFFLTKKKWLVERFAVSKWYSLTFVHVCLPIHFILPAWPYCTQWCAPKNVYISEFLGQ